MGRHEVPEKTTISDIEGKDLIVEPDGSISVDHINEVVNVNVIDDISPPFDYKMFKRAKDGFALVETPVVNSNILRIIDPIPVLVPGDRLILFEESNIPQLYVGDVVSINPLGGLLYDVTLDAPVPFPFTPGYPDPGSVMLTVLIQMNVVGSIAAPNTFTFTNIFQQSVDVTRIIIHMTDGTSMDDEKFGGMPALANGIVCRKKLIEGEDYINFWNVKTNGDFAALAYDLKYTDPSPAGVYGMTTRMSYAGQHKHGVVIRLNYNEAIEFVIQDDLTDLESFTATFEGHLAPQST